ncbi:MAG TPA: glycosyltransferase family 2 protein [Candidatus Saccharimonadales bacterium]|nr:glycosyltransferase family 2 protein [Candidatus Saccharimonadales bacterium]
MKHRYVMALLIAAHNEEIVLANTLNLAIKAGMKPEHIYVVDDCSDDSTGRVARSILGKENVCRVRRSGKGLALSKGAKKFALSEGYRWIHVADADGGFSKDYFRILRRDLRVKYAAGTGYVRSFPGHTVGQYRVFEYTIGMEIHRRFQALTNTIAIIPGPTSCFRHDIFNRINFANNSLTEDFDVTLQIHRNKLGKIQFIPEAVAYTQDPGTFTDFVRQIIRWNRGIMQGIVRHKVGRRFKMLDSYLTYQLLENFMFFVSYFIFIPYLSLSQHDTNIPALAFLIDVAIIFILTVLVAMKSRRMDILSAFPHIYLFRWISLMVFIKTFTEVVILRKFRDTEGIWDSSGRYRLQAN